MTLKHFLQDEKRCRRFVKVSVLYSFALLSSYMVMCLFKQIGVFNVNNWSSISSQIFTISIYLYLKILSLIYDLHCFLPGLFFCQKSGRRSEGTFPLLYYYDQFVNVCFIIKSSDQEGSQTYIPYIAVKSFTTLLIFLSRYSLSSFRSKS